MSELKAKHVVDVYEAYAKTGDDDAAQVYPKSEADKVIAEKDKKIAELKSLKQALMSDDLRYRDKIRHHKYKRCLAMAKRCHWKKLYWRDSFPAYSNQFKWENRADKWEKRWLELAEKFKRENDEKPLRTMSVFLRRR